MIPSARNVLQYQPKVDAGRSRGRPFDPAAFVGIVFGLGMCIPILTGVVAILCGISIFRTVDSSLGELACGTIAILLGTLNIGLWCMMALTWR